MRPGYAWGEEQDRAPLGSDPMFPDLAAALRAQERARHQQSLIDRTVTPTGASAMAKIAAAMLGHKAERDAEDRLQQAHQGVASERQAEMARVMGALTGKQEMPGPPTAGGERSMANVPTDPQSQMAALLAARDPAFRALGTQMAQGMLMPKPRSLKWESFGDTKELVDEQGNVVRSRSIGTSPDAVYNKSTPSADAKMADARMREQFLGRSGDSQANEQLQRYLHGTPSANTTFVQEQENARHAAGIAARPPAASGTTPAERNYDDARQTYSTLYGSAYMGVQNGPPFKEWLATEWPKIRAAGGLPGGGPPVPGRSAGGPITSGPVRVNNEAEYNALPSGATYIKPDGTIRKKP